MIVVDSSVWIGHFRNADNECVRKFRAIENLDEIIVGDLIMLEVLRGARDERHASQLEGILRRFHTMSIFDDALAVKAAAHDRALRARGITVRKTADLIIATFCVERGHSLLHDDRGFDGFALHLGLATV
jgi:predicted nucleic acid-binding protein